MRPIADRLRAIGRLRSGGQASGGQGSGGQADWRVSLLVRLIQSQAA
jgi:hypothetical protein